MAKTYASPLSPEDLDALIACARKGNALSRDLRLAPMYCAADGGDASQPNAWLFVCWPAQNPAATRAGFRLLDLVGKVAAEELGATMQVTTTDDEGL